VFGLLDQILDAVDHLMNRVGVIVRILLRLGCALLLTAVVVAQDP